MFDSLRRMLGGDGTEYGKDYVIGVRCKNSGRPDYMRLEKFDVRPVDLYSIIGRYGRSGPGTSTDVELTIEPLRDKFDPNALMGKIRQQLRHIERTREANEELARLYESNELMDGSIDTIYASEKDSFYSDAMEGAKKLMECMNNMYGLGKQHEKS